MGHADIATTMIYVHHVPQSDAADKLSGRVTVAQNPVSGHVRDTVTEPDRRQAKRKSCSFQHVRDGPAWTRTRDRRIMS